MRRLYYIYIYMHVYRNTFAEDIKHLETNEKTIEIILFGKQTLKFVLESILISQIIQSTAPEE
jgi:hypothetical protein